MLSERVLVMLTEADKALVARVAKERRISQAEVLRLALHAWAPGRWRAPS